MVSINRDRVRKTFANYTDNYNSSDEKIKLKINHNVIGKNFDFLLNGEVTNDISTGDIKGLNVGIGAGVAYDLDFGLTIGARYSYGFNKMAKNLDWKMGNIQVSIGWLF